MTVPASPRAAACELLFACAVWDATAPQLARVRDAARGVEDWAAWMAMARLHRIVPHARRALLESESRVPASVADELSATTVTIAAHALGRARQLADLVRLLGEAGVRALPYKGPVLSLVAYGDLGVRESVDLDLVVLPADLARARDALGAAGYVSRAGMSAAQERLLQRSFGHLAYARDGTPAGVELHWRFSAPRYPWSLPPAEVFARASTIDVAGTPLPAPDPTDRLLLQAMHGARHQWERLEWLVAFRQLLGAGTADPAALVARARSHGSDRALRVGLRLARDLLGAPLPPALSTLAAGEPAGALAAELAGAIERSLASGVLPTAQPYRLNLRLMDRAPDRVRYLAWSVAAPTVREWELIRLPDALLPLYYPIRLARVLVTRVRSPFARR